MEIISHIPLPKRGFPSKVPLVKIVNAILYKLKPSAQWHQLPTQIFFKENPLSWESVYYHYRNWSVNDVWNICWIGFLSKYKSNFDLSSVYLNGSHTTTKQVEYQGRKKRKTTNAFHLSDRKSLPLVMNEPVARNHNDFYNIEVQFKIVTVSLEQAYISVDGLFLNTNTGFDSKNFREFCSKKEIHTNIF